MSFYENWDNCFFTSCCLRAERHQIETWNWSKKLTFTQTLAFYEWNVTQYFGNLIFCLLILVCALSTYKCRSICSDRIDICSGQVPANINYRFGFGNIIGWPRHLDHGANWYNYILLWFEFWIVPTFWPLPNATCIPPKKLWIPIFIHFASAIFLTRFTIGPHSPWTSFWKIAVFRKMILSVCLFCHRLRQFRTIWNKKEFFELLDCCRMLVKKNSRWS